MSLPLLLAIPAAVFAGESESGDLSGRREMVDRQLRDRGISDARVLAAMDKVPRQEFVPLEWKQLAHGDRPLPIGHGQTISQPYIVALMTELLRIDADSRVLEIGTGSGYQAAVLAELVSEVFTMEIIVPLALQADETLKRLGYRNVHVKVGEGHLGWPEEAPFDAIIVTCAPAEVPSALVQQLREGGRMAIPIGENGGVQELYVLEKIDGQIRKTPVSAVRFVPMIHGAPQPP
jgi:protein-L-isoaspartate(D-aspartate) O-methyltransferase